jgi:serine phosphatase RsbU (regulator of sigma subunit)
MGAAAAIEVAAAAVVAGGGWAAGWAVAGAHESPVRWAAAGAVAVTVGGLQIALSRRGRAGGTAAAAPATPVDPRDVRTVLESSMAQGPVEHRPMQLARGLAQVVAAAGVEDVRLYAMDQLHGTLMDVTGGAVIPLDRRVATWLGANSIPFHAAQVRELRLGGLRDPVEQFVRSTGAELLLPLVHRDRLVGLAVGRGRVRKGASLVEAQEATAAALGQLLLEAAVAEQAEVAHEVAAAASVHRDTEPRTTVEELGGCRIARYYAPARQFSGAWWIARALSDGRVFTALGEVTGRGVPAALLSATAMGVCEATMIALRGGIELHGLLELMHASVRAAGRGAYGMSCVLSLIDPGSGLVAFSSAGHPFPYRVRRVASGNERDAVRVMVSRGSQIGGHDEPVRSLASEEIARGDLLVFYSASTTDARAEEGQTFGERRLQHTLRRATVIGANAPDGTPLATHVGLAVDAHVAGRPLDDDVLIATVEIL